MRRALLAFVAAAALAASPGKAFADNPKPGEAPAAFSLDEQLQGQKIKALKSLRGRAVIVDIFANW